MSIPLSGEWVAGRIEAEMEGVVTGFNETDVWVRPDDLVRVGRLLRDGPQIDLQMLNSISAVDYVEYFELVYHFRSLRLNTSFVLKSRCCDRESPSIPSLTGVWPGADLQEREAWVGGLSGASASQGLHPLRAVGAFPGERYPFPLKCL